MRIEIVINNILSDEDVARNVVKEVFVSDQLLEILTHDQNLNERFIDVVEKIHMKKNDGCIILTQKPGFRKSIY